MFYPLQSIALFVSSVALFTVSNYLTCHKIVATYHVSKCLCNPTLVYSYTDSQNMTYHGG